MSEDSARSSASPSADPISPQANAWMSQDASGRPSATASPGQSPGASRTAKHAQSARVQDLARRLGEDPEELAARLSPEMLRRLKYPVHAVHNEDGTVTYLEDKGIVEGVQSGRGTDVTSGPIARVSARDASGQFAK